MKKYRLIKEGRPLTAEEIESVKNFESLTQQYQKLTRRPTVPLYKNPWAFIALVIIILLLLLLTGEL